MTLDVGPRQSVVDGRGPQVTPSQVLHLVLHQGDERCDDETEAAQCQCRHLEGDAFAAAGRHEAESVAAGRDAADDVELDAAEVVISPVGAENAAERLVIRLWPGNVYSHGRMSSICNWTSPRLCVFSSMA